MRHDPSIPVFKIHREYWLQLEPVRIRSGIWKDRHAFLIESRSHPRIGAAGVSLLKPATDTENECILNLNETDIERCENS